MKLTEEDNILLTQKGITAQMLENQLALFNQGIPFADLRNPATLGDGLFSHNHNEQESLIALFEQRKEELDLLNLYQLLVLLLACLSSYLLF